MKRIHCEHEGEAAKAPYHYTECGLDDVYLLSGYDKEETEYGETVSIRHADELHRAIGQYLVQNKKILTGKELRFLRKEMDLTQAELGKLMGLTYQAVARWEKDKNEITGPADYLIRVLFMEHLGMLDDGVSIRELLCALEEHDANQLDERQIFQLNSDWEPVPLAA